MLNVNEFLSMETSEASERPPLIPAGEYQALVAPDGIDLKDFKYKKGDREGQTGYRMTLKWEIQDEDLKAQLGRSPMIVQSIMLNFTPEGALAAENPGLKQVREAVDQNKDGQPWQPAMLIGQMARILVEHRIDDKGEEQHEVKKVGAL
jgi:hypothetical protein